MKIQYVCEFDYDLADLPKPYTDMLECVKPIVMTDERSGDFAGCIELTGIGFAQDKNGDWKRDKAIRPVRQHLIALVGDTPHDAIMLRLRDEITYHEAMLTMTREMRKNAEAAMPLHPPPGAGVNPQ
jgi:hypothetical protein